MRRRDRQALYALVESRRLQWDNLVWQVPLLSLTAQAFLFSIALGAGTSTLARVIASSLAIVVTFLSITLMARQRQAELVDAHWLEEQESDWDPADKQHGQAWRDRRNATAPGGGWVDVVVPLLPGYVTWIVGLSLFGIAAAGIIVIAIVWPDLLA